MKSIFALIALLIVCLAVQEASAQVGNDKLHLLVEYFLPYWRQHRARLRPYAFAQPVPVWRVARSAGSENGPAAEQPQPVRDDYIGCLAFESKFLCERITNDRRTNENVVCEIKKQFTNPILNNFVSFSITEKRVDGQGARYNLLPKKPTGLDLDLSQLKDARQLSLHWKEDKQEDGFAVQDKKCWTKLNQLLDSVQAKTITVKKVNAHDELTPSNTENIVGNFISIDFGL
jgi:hypothetical protein